MCVCVGICEPRFVGATRGRIACQSIQTDKKKLPRTRTGLGKLLMGYHTTVAENLPPIGKVMLTCFLSNSRGLDFYKKMGFETDEISPVARQLRNTIVEPDYVILSKRIFRRNAAVAVDRHHQID